MLSDPKIIKAVRQVFYYLILSQFVMAKTVIAGIVPDDSLASKVNSLDNLNFLIEGGGRAGTNLFHSFQEFSVEAGATAYFNNALDISNIITRVTGSSISNIQGILKTNGTANLFLLNPNGILFGSNASLELDGSFIATTANNLVFSDGTEFSTANPIAPTLTITTPVGLQFGQNSATIINQSRAIGQSTFQGQTFPEELGLRVQRGKTLALIGGDINIDDGLLTADEGRIEIGSVSNNNFVTLIPISEGWKLGYEAVENFQNIKLSNNSGIRTNGLDFASGSIRVRGKTLTLNNSIISSFNFSESNEVGSTEVRTENLTLQNGSTIQVNTSFANARGGDLFVISNTIELAGTTVDGSLPSGLFAQTFGAGNAGNLEVNTQKLTMRGGAQIAASTFNVGAGGNLTIKADSVTIDGKSENGDFRSGLFAQSTSQAIGDAGSLSVDTRELIVQNGAIISVSSINSNPEAGAAAGNLRINSDFILLNNKGILLADTRGGEGNITLKSEDIRLLNESGISTNAVGEVPGGNITIDTNTLVALHNSDITANAGQGTGGRVVIDAQGIFGTEFRDELTDQSDITATSELGTEFSGTVEILTPGVDPSQGLVNLPEDVVDVAGLIEQGCAVMEESSFLVRGRGGLPPSPSDALSSANLWVDLGEQVSSSTTSRFSNLEPSISDISIVEAQGWIVNSNGNLILTANPQQVAAQQSWQTQQQNCPTKAS